MFLTLTPPAFTSQVLDFRQALPCWFMLVYAGIEPIISGMLGKHYINGVNPLHSFFGVFDDLIY